MKQLRAGGLEPLLVDGGNSLVGGIGRRPSVHRVRQEMEKAKVIIAGFNRMGYHAMAVGAGEIALGLEHLKELEKLMEFPLLCANLVVKETGEPVFTPSTIVAIDGVRIGIFGLILTTFQADYLESIAPGCEVLDVVEAGRKAAAALRSRVAFVVGLCHTNDDETRALLAACPDVDIVVDPYCFSGSHRVWVPEGEFLQWVDQRALLRVDGQGSRVGRFDIFMGEKGLPFVPWSGYQKAHERKDAGAALTDAEKTVLAEGLVRHVAGAEEIMVYPHFAEAPEIKVLVDRFRRSTRFEPTDVAKEEARAREAYLTAANCKACHERNYKAWRGTQHGKAYATLAATGDEFRYDCLPCHTLGYGEAFLDAHKVGPYKDVQCESCHGTNPRHSEDPDAHPWDQVTAARCLVCHNPEHLGIPFNFKEKVRIQTSCIVPEP